MITFTSPSLQTFFDVHSNGQNPDHFVISKTGDILFLDGTSMSREGMMYNGPSHYESQAYPSVQIQHRKRFYQEKLVIATSKFKALREELLNRAKNGGSADPEELKRLKGMLADVRRYQAEVDKATEEMKPVYARAAPTQPTDNCNYELKALIEKITI